MARKKRPTLSEFRVAPNGVTHLIRLHVLRRPLTEPVLDGGRARTRNDWAAWPAEPEIVIDGQTYLLKLLGPELGGVEEVLDGRLVYTGLYWHVFPDGLYDDYVVLDRGEEVPYGVRFALYGRPRYRRKKGGA